MKLNKLCPRTYDELIDHIKSKKASFYHSSKTSTVVPYDQIESGPNDFGLRELTIVSLTELPKSLALSEDGVLTVEGPVTWQEARAFCHSKGRDIMTSPTEELACVLAGVATSATGERSFGFGTLREQIVSIEYLDFKGSVRTLQSSKEIELDDDLIEYRKSFEKFSNFKNAPFPRIQKETDLLVGTEGQLGVITKCNLKTTVLEERNFIFIKLPRWEEDFSKHLEVYSKVQGFRSQVYSCELLDSNAMSALPEEEKLIESGDLIFLEVQSKSFDKVYEELISKLELVREEDMFELSAAKSHRLRVSVPRYTFERNSRMGVVKKGTDIQVSAENFPRLLHLYKSMTTLGISYNLFGHFGDAHLHFNFLPDKESVDTCQDLLEKLYEKIALMSGSPFAEHGVGLIKQKFILNFLEPIHFKIFEKLKKEHDPDNIFFPIGFLNLKRSIG